MKPFQSITIIATLMILSACAIPDLQSSPGAYRIKTKDGREVFCHGKPLLQESTGYYRYRTLDNRDAVIRKDDVAVIEKRNV
ncbi:MAG: YgdI/YgdR family lipoprotein [Prosthecobacter sp.]